MTMFAVCVFASRYTGKERDAESTLDYFGARFYGSMLGCWMSPDPSSLVFADPTNPQSLDLYTYGLNSPLRLVDPNGLLLCEYGPSDTHDGNDFEDADNIKDVPKTEAQWSKSIRTLMFILRLREPIFSIDQQVAQADEYLASHKLEGSDPDFGMKVIAAVGKDARCKEGALKKNGVSLAFDATGTAMGYMSGEAEVLDSAIATQVVVGTAATAWSAKSAGDSHGGGTAASGTMLNAFSMQAGPLAPLPVGLNIILRRLQERVR